MHLDENVDKNETHPLYNMLKSILGLIDSGDIKERYYHALPTLMKADAITIGSTVYYRMGPEDIKDSLRVHEATHVWQYKSIGIPLFLIIYAYDYLSGRFRGLSHREAYLGIDFEKQAFGLEDYYKEVSNERSY